MNKEKKMLSLLNHWNDCREDSGYFAIDVSEKERLMDIFRKKRKRRGNVQRKRALAVAAAVCVLAGSAIRTPFGRQVYANVRSSLSEIRYSLSQALGKTEDYAPYTNLQDQTMSIGGRMIRLNEAALDGERLVINHLVQCETPDDVAKLQQYLLRDLTIDGQKTEQLAIYLQQHPNLPKAYEDKLFVTAESIRITRVDEEKGIYGMTFSLEFAKPLPTDRPVNISYRLEDRERVSAEKNRFLLSVDARKLAKDTIRSGEGVQLRSEEGKVFTVKGLEMNLLSQRIFLQTKKNGSDKSPKYLVGEDQAKHRIVFESRGAYPTDEGLEMRFDFADEDARIEERRSEISGEEFYRTGESYSFRLYALDEDGSLIPISDKADITVQH